MLSKHVLAFFTLGGLLMAPVPVLAIAQHSPPPHNSSREYLAQENRQPFPLEDFEFWSAQCVALSQEDDPQKTLESCEQAILLEPDEDNLDLWSLRSQALFNLGSYPEAIASFQRVLTIAPANSFALAYQCAAYRALERYSQAVDTCEAALRENGDWGTRSPGFAWYQRGLALQEMGRLETALSSFQRADENQPEDVQYRASLCALASDLGDFSICDLREAIAAYEQAIALHPEDASLWFHQGLALEQQEAYEQALTSFTRALALTPTHSLTLAHQCAVLNHLEDYEAALTACEAAFAGDQDWGRVGPAYGWVQQSSAQIGAGDYPAALASTERAIVIPIPDTNPAILYPPAFNNQAVSLWHLGEWDAALSASETAIASYEQNRNSFNERFVRGYPESPITYYRGLIMAYYNQGRILMSMENYGEAIAAYNQALTLNRDCRVAYSLSAPTLCLPQLANSAIVNPSDLADIFTNQAIAYLAMGQVSNATGAAREAAFLAPQSFAVRYNEGLVLFEAGQYSQAFRAYTLANQLMPGNVYVLTGQGMSLARLGCTQEALTLLENVLNLSPGYPLAEQVRADLVANATSTPAQASNSNTCPVLDQLAIGNSPQN